MNVVGDFITYADTPSLKSAAMTRFVARLWEEQLLQQAYNCTHRRHTHGDYYINCICINFMLMDNCSDYDHDHDFTVLYHDLPLMEKNVLSILFALQLPKTLEREIRRYVMHIGKTFLSWLDPQYFRLGLRKSRHIFWTNEGTIDASETIRYAYYHNEFLDYEMIMAISNACLEDLLLRVWESRPSYSNDFVRGLCQKHKYDAHLVVYWLCFCKNDFSQLFDFIANTDDFNMYERNHSVFRNMFDLSIQTGNKVSAKYFWPKLTGEEQNSNIMAWIDSLFESIDGEDQHNYYYGRKDGFLGILFFLLGRMNDSEQQKQVFQKHRESMINLLIFEWPWQKYLVQTISVMFSLMEDDEYIDFIGELIFSVGKGRAIEGLFGDVWHESPLNFRTRYVEHLMESLSARLDTFRNLFDIYDLNDINIITSSMTGEDKRVFILSGIQNQD